MRTGSKIEQAFLKIVEKVRECHEKAPDNRKAEILALVSHLSAPTLEQLGFQFSKKSLAHARKHEREHTPGLPKPHVMPKSKRAKPQALKDAVYQHLVDNSSPMANNTSLVDGKRVPSRGVIDSWDFLFHDFCLKNPLAPQHTVGKTKYDEWRKGFKIFKKAKKLTDVCEICVNGKKIVAQLGKLEQKYPGITKDPVIKSFEALDDVEQIEPHFEDHIVIKVQGLMRERQFYENHISGKNAQRDSFNREVSDLGKQIDGKKAIVILDYKENLKLNVGPVQQGRDYYEQTQRSLLGFVVLLNDGNGVVKKIFVNFVSQVLSKDGLFSSDCMKVLMKLPMFAKIKQLSVWSDSGPHFRCGEFAFCLFDTLFKETSFDSVSWNLFVEKHGKNLCDTHFSSLSSWLKQAELDGHISTTEELIAALEKQIGKTNQNLRVKGKPEVNVIFKIHKRFVRPNKRTQLSVPMIRSLYCFARDRSDLFMTSKCYAKDSNPRKTDLKAITEVKKTTAKIKQAPKFPQNPGPHYFGPNQLSCQAKAVKFRDEQNADELASLMHSAAFFGTAQEPSTIMKWKPQVLTRLLLLQMIFFHKILFCDHDFQSQK